MLGVRAGSISVSLALHACLVSAVLMHAAEHPASAPIGPVVNLVGQSIRQPSPVTEPLQAIEPLAERPVEATPAIGPAAPAKDSDPAVPQISTVSTPEDTQSTANLPTLAPSPMDLGIVKGEAPANEIVARQPPVLENPPIQERLADQETGEAARPPADSAAAQPTPVVAASEQPAIPLPALPPSEIAAAPARLEEARREPDRFDAASSPNLEARPIDPIGASVAERPPADARPASLGETVPVIADPVAALAPARGPEATPGAVPTPDPLRAQSASLPVQNLQVEPAEPTSIAPPSAETPVIASRQSLATAEQHAAALPAVPAHETAVDSVPVPPVRPVEPAQVPATLATSAPTLIVPPAARLDTPPDVAATLAPVLDDRPVDRLASIEANDVAAPIMAAPPLAAATPEAQAVSASPLPDRMAALETPSRLDEIRSFVDHYGGGPCFFVSPARVTAEGGEIEGFSPTVSAVDRFEAEFRTALKVEPHVTGQRVWSSQCPAVEFLRQTSIGRPVLPVVEIDDDLIRSGGVVSGAVRGVEGRAVRLLLISETGIVSDVSAGLQRSGKDMTFEVPVRTDKDGGPFPQMLLAIAGPTGAANAGRTGAAQAFFDGLATTRGSLTAAARLFRLSR